MTELWLFLIAGLAGALNAMAGGGSFLTLPALVAAGLPPTVANATGTLALLPGYLTGAWALRRDIAQTTEGRLSTLLAVALAGGGVGALLLVWTPAEAFRHVAPWLLLFATLVFLAAPMALRAVRGRTLSAAGLLAALAAVCAYGGYFNGGVGIMLLAVFSLWPGIGPVAGNGLKNLISGVLTFVAVAVYAAGGLVVWREAGLMAVGAALGGFVGARLGRRLPASWMRAFVVALGLSMTGVMFARA